MLARVFACFVLIIIPISSAQSSTLGETRADQTVTLASRDGTIKTIGELVSFDGAAYLLQTAIGRVSVPVGNAHCVAGACPDPDLQRLTLSGAHTLGTELIPALIDAYSYAREADVALGATSVDGTRTLRLTHFSGESMADVALRTRGSSSGLQDLIGGTAQIALATRPVVEGDLTAASAAKRNPVESVLALDGLLIVTAPDNPVRALSMESIAKIFAGRITNWSEVGGLDAPIVLYGRATDSGTGSIFNSLVMQPQRFRVGAAMNNLKSDADVSDAVQNNPLGIGFTSYSNERGAKSVAIQGVCGIQTPATAFTIKAEEYPLTRRLFAYRAAQSAPMVEDFLTFAISDEAQPVIARTGFVDLGVSALGINEMGLRFVAAMLPSNAETQIGALQSMTSDLIAAERLSLTFRFENGSSTLDSRAKSDLVRLAKMIADGRMLNKEVMLIGFTDAVGRADINAHLSQTRAEQTADALRALLPPGTSTEISSIGYGEMSPLGCNETANGRRINRRVEVWTRDVMH